MRLRSRAIFAALCLLFVSCRSAPETDASCGSTRADLRDKGILTLGVDFTYPPFAFVDGQGNQRGLEVDIGRALAREMKLEYAVVNRTSSVLVPLVLAHRFDVAASGLRDTAALRRQVCLTSSYMGADLGLLTRVDRTGGINSAGSIRGRKIGTLNGSRAKAWLHEHMKNETVQTFPTEEDVLTALKSGTIDVAVDELALARFAQNRTGGSLHVAATIRTGERYVFAVSNDNGGLAAKINDALGKVRGSGKLGEIEKKWLGD